MPWNSTKSGINIAHPVFERLQPTLAQLMAHFSTLSRHLKGDWEGSVFKFDGGKIEKVEPSGTNGRTSLILPPLPRATRAGLGDLKADNEQQIRKMPWTLGLIEAIGAVDIIRRQKLQTKNRIALILLDSNFEIALKEFVVHRTDLFPVKEFTDSRIEQLFRDRPAVIQTVTKKILIPKDLLDIAAYHYRQRNKLIHERASMTVTDADVQGYRSTIESILEILFKLKFES
jgi:hypothetical protein